MMGFRSKWDTWEAQTQKKRTDSTDNAPPDTALSALSVQKNSVSENPALPQPGRDQHSDPCSQGEGVQPEAVTIRPVESVCRICGGPADDSDSNILAAQPVDQRVHTAAECYGAWFEAAFGKAWGNA